MEYYTLQNDEVALFQAENVWCKEKKAKVQVILTNLALVLVEIRKKLFSKNADVEVLLLETIKYYNEQPYIKHKETNVETYFLGAERTLEFGSKKEAKQFVTQAINTTTKTTTLERGLRKVKQTVDTVDNTLGIDSVGIVKKAAGGVFNGKNKITKLFGKKEESVKEIAASKTDSAKQ